MESLDDRLVRVDNALFVVVDDEPIFFVCLLVRAFANASVVSCKFLSYTEGIEHHIFHSVLPVIELRLFVICPELLRRFLY
jgi:hypothetical protein